VVRNGKLSLKSSPFCAFVDATLCQTPQRDRHEFFASSIQLPVDHDLRSRVRSRSRCAIADQHRSVRGVEQKSLRRSRICSRHHIRWTLVLWPARFGLPNHHPRSAWPVVQREDDMPSVWRRHTHHTIDCLPECPNQIAERICPHSRQQENRLRVVSEIPLKSAPHVQNRSARWRGACHPRKSRCLSSPCKC